MEAPLHWQQDLEDFADFAENPPAPGSPEEMELAALIDRLERYRVVFERDEAIASVFDSRMAVLEGQLEAFRERFQGRRSLARDAEIPDRGPNFPLVT